MEVDFPQWKNKGQDLVLGVIIAPYYNGNNEFISFVIEHLEMKSFIGLGGYVIMGLMVLPNAEILCSEFFQITAREVKCCSQVQMYPGFYLA